MSERPEAGPVRAWLLDLQDRICAALEAEETSGARFREDRFESPAGGLARPRVLEDGAVIEKCAVHFSHTRGARLPAAATERRPALAGRAYEAVSVSLIVHPRNPYVPTTHMNVRFFATHAPGGPGGGAAALPEAPGPAAVPGGSTGDAAPTWWIGGGFDLTPCYGFEEDARHWHRTARDACAPLGPGAHARFKKWCDEYFQLPHRGEPRGIGGIFFDDLDEGGFERCFAFLRSVGEHWLPAYLPILRRRKDAPWGERERAFQLQRRGRYAEFNLVQDRGTRFGLQSAAQGGGRVESILASLPPLAAWRYDWRPAPGTPEARLAEEFLRPRDWLAEGD